MKESLSRPQIGDEVGLRAVRQDAVKVRAHERDAQGKVVAEKDLETHRNRWIVEKRAFFEARAEAARTLRDAASTRSRPSSVIRSSSAPISRCTPRSSPQSSSATGGSAAVRETGALGAGRRGSARRAAAAGAIARDAHPSAWLRAPRAVAIASRRGCASRLP